MLVNVFVTPLTTQKMILILILAIYSVAFWPLIERKKHIPSDGMLSNGEEEENMNNNNNVKEDDSDNDNSNGCDDDDDHDDDDDDIDDDVF